MLEAITRMRSEMAVLVEQLRDKEERALKLNAEFESMSKEVNRNVYTRRIIDIIKQIRKQKSEIARIIADVRVVQREINFASEKVEPYGQHRRGKHVQGMTMSMRMHCAVIRQHCALVFPGCLGE
jgi:chromosome segregation ATPase